MDKRYQVFVSSTYADLQQERRAVMQSVIEMSCIPAGMELFPAADEAQLEFIKRVIDDCDYYLLIIGGRYGSVDETGVSFTEQEYDYAVGRGLKVIALLHKTPGAIPYDKSEVEPALRQRLEAFRTKAATGRMVKFWTTADQLPGLVSQGLSHAMRTYPAIGWARADKIANVEVLGEINELRKRTGQLEQELSESKATLAELNPPLPLDDLAGLDETVRIWGTNFSPRIGEQVKWNKDEKWRDIFGYIAPYLSKHPRENVVKEVLTEALFGGREGSGPIMHDQYFQTIGIQLEALGLVKIEYTQDTSGYGILHWTITTAGKHLMLDVRAVRTKIATTK
jgi:hypothetical protein